MQLPSRCAVEQDGAQHRQRPHDEGGAEEGRHEPAHPTTLASAAMPTLQHVAPIFPTADMDAMQAHYEALGFSVHVHGFGYATVARDGIRIHFKLVPDMTPATERGAAYLVVDDATALHAEWLAAAVGETTELFDPGFGVLEAAHTDDEGNLLRFGSPQLA
jgi:hypothetical protein